MGRGGVIAPGLRGHGVFETRLKTVLTLFGLALLVIVVRLVDLQVVRADVYRKQAEQALLRPARMLPSVRGRILDRFGTELAADQPCWEVAVDYRVLTIMPAYLREHARHLRESTEPGISQTEAEEEIRRRIDRMWKDLASFSETSIADLRVRGDEICARVARVRAAVTRQRGFDTPIAEERMCHALVTGLNDQDQITARQLLQGYPWLEVRNSTTRSYYPSKSLPHLLGQQGAVTSSTLENDPERDDPLARYLASETLGVTGVEYAAERRLRGRRGLIRRNRGGETVENIAATNGEDVTLTLRLDLQEALYTLLERAIPNTPYPTGGAIVVLDVPTRQVLAMVSYPGYDNNTFRSAYNDLARDARHQPLRFRGVANQYAPGSIIKPLTCIAGLTTGKITLGTTFDCQGYYYPKTRSGRKCWPIHGTNQRMAHGSLTVSEAIAHSCNIFMYHTGERVGVAQLCNYFDMAGVGLPSGIGLREEVRGINPTPSYLSARGESVSKGDAWNFAIGQGEVSMTPVQTANLAAVYAGGIYKKVVLLREETTAAEWRLPVKPEHWRAIRTGLFRVTNQPGATAYRTAHLVRDGYALCGKTGSATVGPWAVAYAIPYTSPKGTELTAIVSANSKREAVERFAIEYRGTEFARDEVEACKYWPPLSAGRRRPTKADQQEHAWFIGYLQAVDRAGQPLHEVAPRIAFSVLVEFGGSGGRVAGPIAVKVAETMLDTLGAGLDPDGVYAGAEP